MDLNEIFISSKAIAEFDSTDEALINNAAFIMAWSLARQKSLQTMQMINALLLIKIKYNIADFDFELFLENFDETNLLGE
jgi:hypothetical protein